MYNNLDNIYKIYLQYVSFYFSYILADFRSHHPELERKQLQQNIRYTYDIITGSHLANY